MSAFSVIANVFVRRGGSEGESWNIYRKSGVQDGGASTPCEPHGRRKRLARRARPTTSGDKTTAAALAFRGSWWTGMMEVRLGGASVRPPPRGGGRGHERDVQVARQTSDKGRDGGSTAECRCNKPETCQKQAGKVFCGRAMRKVGVTASRSTPPDALPIRSEYSFLGHSVRRAPPPLGGGENARAHSVRPTGAGNSFRFPFHKNTEDFTAPKERPGSGRLPGRGEGRD